jgi:hypothetical protein
MNAKPRQTRGFLYLYNLYVSEQIYYLRCGSLMIFTVSDFPERFQVNVNHLVFRYTVLHYGLFIGFKKLENEHLRWQSQLGSH